MSNKIAVRRAGGEPILGQVVGRDDAGRNVVEWPDGSRQSIGALQTSIQFIDAGTLLHRALSAPDALRSEFATAPHEVLIALLKERGKPLRAQELKAGMVELGLTQRGDDRWWLKAKKHLAADPHVVEEGKPATYRWSDQAVDPHQGLTRLPVSELLDIAATKSDPGRSERAKELVLERQDQLTAEQTLVALALDVLKAPVPRPVPPLDSLSHQQLQRLLDHPHLSQDTELLFRAASLPKGSIAADRAATALTALQGGPEQRLAQLLSDSLLQWTQPGRRQAGFHITVGRLAENLGHLFGRPAVASAALRLLIALSGGEPAAREDLLNAVGACPSIGQVTADLLLEIDLARLAEAVADLSLGPRTARTKYMSKLSRTPAQGILSDPSMWQGLNLDAAVASVGTAMGDLLLERSPLRDTVLTPMIIKAAQGAAGRGDLAVVLSLPEPLAALLPGHDFAEAVERVRASDARLAEWLDSTEAGGRTRGLQHRADTAERESARLTRALEELEQAYRNSVQRGQQLEDRLRGVHVGSSEANRAQLRQASIDGMRAFVDLLAEIDRYDSGEADERLVELRQRARLLMKQRHVVQVGRRGEVVAFDQSKHVSLVGDLPHTARVIASGYAWQDGSASIVLRKADVVAATD